MFVKMVMIYVRGAKERRYLRDLLGRLVQGVLEEDFLDLESDPLMVRYGPKDYNRRKILQMHTDRDCL